MAFSEDNSISHDITTDAGFRAWAGKIHDALVAVGMVELNDTGEITIASATTPGVNSTYAGFEVFRFNDSEQGTKPVFFKVEYGRGTAASRGALRITVGTATDGAGTLTNASSAIVLAPALAPASNGRIHASFLNGGLGLFWTADTSSSSTTTSTALLVIERLRETDGTATTDNAIALVGMAAAFSTHVFHGGIWNLLAQAQRLLVGPVSATGGGVVIFGQLHAGFTIYPWAPLRGALIGFLDSVAAADSGTATVPPENTAITYKRPNCSARFLMNDLVSTVTCNVLLPAE